MAIGIVLDENVLAPKEGDVKNEFDGAVDKRRSRPINRSAGGVDAGVEGTRTILFLSFVFFYHTCT